MTNEERERDDGHSWGFLEGDQFIPLPKLPLLRAGLGPPPFNVELPSGHVRHVVSWLGIRERRIDRSSECR